jgi:hypothetical protein
VPAVSDQDYLARYDDAGHASPCGLRVTQESWSWASSPKDDFVILRYTLINEGDRDLHGLYVGQFMDWDLPAEDPESNLGAADSALQLAYMWPDAGDPYVGTALLETGSEPGQLANLTLVDKSAYVAPQGYLLDTDRYLFLCAGDPAHCLQEVSAGDWGTLVSAGPWDLGPGDHVVVAFALAGGIDQTDLFQNVGAARQVYDQIAALSDAPDDRADWGIHRIVPNPATSEAVIHFAMPMPGRAGLYVLDVSGRIVRTLMNGSDSPGSDAVSWDTRDDGQLPVESGIYIIRLSGMGRVSTQRVVIVR